MLPRPQKLNVELSNKINNYYICIPGNYFICCHYLTTVNILTDFTCEPYIINISNKLRDLRRCQDNTL